MVLEIFRSIVELASGLGGLYAIYQCMKQLRSILRASTVEDAWASFTKLMAWGAASCAALLVCALAGARSMGVLVLAVLMALLIVGAGGFLAIVRVKTLRRGAQFSPSAFNSGELVVVRALVHGRMRGQDESGGEVRFTPEELEMLIGIRGHVRMLNWASARKSGDHGRGIAPLLGFTGEHGEAFVIYPDDQVVLAS